MTPQRSYAKSDLLAWARDRAPDLRISYSREDDHIISWARFSWDSEVVDLDEIDDPTGEKVVRAVVEEIRAREYLPPLFQSGPGRLQMEKQIILARLAGNDAEADQLTREMLFARPGRRNATILGAKTQIGTRKT